LFGNNADNYYASEKKIYNIEQNNAPFSVEAGIDWAKKNALNLVWKNFLNGEILNGLVNIRKDDGPLITSSFNLKSNILSDLSHPRHPCPDFIGKNAFDWIHSDCREAVWHCF